ncbi:MAG TPA: adenylyl-sulfate kinase [Candidatus Limnocylindrales bacterium]|nr:adenylyl-sulfate kinase [Candidatus Limnocylindrales bacterium]
MTTPPTPPDDLASVADLPRIVLDADGLDVLELTLAGALPDASPLLARIGGPLARSVVLTDAENTPLALVEDGGVDLAGARSLRPLPGGHGPQWEPSRRRTPATVSAELDALADSSAVLAFVVDDVPTRSDLEAVGERIDAQRPGAVLVVTPAARRPRPPQEFTPGALTRAATIVADRIRGVATARGAHVVQLVVPWPVDAAGLDVATMLASYGATATTNVTDLRNPRDAVRVAALPTLVEREVADLYPAELAEEVLAVVGRAGRAEDRGAVVFFTGLSGSGKSTIARALADELRDVARRAVTLLDGDEVRQLLSSDLGFSPDDRDRNIARIGYVAGLVAAHGGIAIAAPIAPFASGRRRARELVERHAAFVLVHVSTPLDVCEARDRKGLYARARAGEVPEFTGISSPYEVPDDPDVVIDASVVEVPEAVTRVRAALDRRLRQDAPPTVPHRGDEAST